MGFIRRQEERLTILFLERQYRKMHLTAPSPSRLQGQALRIMGETHRITRQTGGNVLLIIKEMIDDLAGLSPWRNWIKRDMIST
jgi:hypothetical protein